MTAAEPATPVAPCGHGVRVEHLRVEFGSTVALDDLTVDIVPGRITGVLGRNGAGKSTLFTLLAGYRRPSAGAVLVDGADVFEDPMRMATTCLVREHCISSLSVRDHLRLAATGRPAWDHELADRLLQRFEVPMARNVGKLSRGKQAALAVITGLASRAELTMFDEPHLGMDAPSRYAFYDELIADYATHPRTILLSTHVIDEIANLIEDVVIVDRGGLVVADSVERLRARGAQLVGPAADVDDVAFGLTVLSSQTLGRTKQVVVYDRLGGDFVRRAAAAGVDAAPLPLQDLFVHLTEPSPGPTPTRPAPGKDTAR